MSEDIDNFMPYLEEQAKSARFILEIGVGKGTGSTMALSHGLEQSPHEPKLMISVDHQDYMEFKPQMDWWQLVMGDSRSTETADEVNAICVPLDAETADIIFIDTDHTPEQIREELWLWEFFAGDNTLWLFHDTYMMGQYNLMTDAIKEFARKHGWEYFDVSTEAHGLGAMRRKK